MLIHYALDESPPALPIRHASSTRDGDDLALLLFLRSEFLAADAAFALKVSRHRVVVAALRVVQRSAAPPVSHIAVHAGLLNQELDGVQPPFRRGEVYAPPVVIVPLVDVGALLDILPQLRHIAIRRRHAKLRCLWNHREILIICKGGLEPRLLAKVILHVLAVARVQQPPHQRVDQRVVQSALQRGVRRDNLTESAQRPHDDS
mmetsp:Transcript_52666/g.92945  ORF Transcript_52666/g.92945 Transcript_52666/m.92945 type:complete len:204 (+) Transcript_52666:156-767(+)